MEHWLATIASRHGEPAAAAQIYRQAALLQGAEIIRPTSGTAPGQIVPTPAGRLVLLPGPPHEMMPMLREALVEHDTPVSIGIRCAGITESDAQVRAERIIHDLPGISLTVLASPSLVDVILVDVGAGEAVLETAAASIEAALGEHVYGREDTTLAEAVLDRARLAGTTIGVAESCTGGMLAAALTDVPGASDAFCGGLVAYSNRVKTALLGVSRDTLGRHGAVSAEVAQEMALGAADALGTDITLSVTGIAGPAGGSDDKPVGLVWFGMARGGTTTAFDHRFPGDRSRIRTRAVVAALNALRHTIEV
jgi:nicotinamide-nucleotide amidase